MLASGPSLRSSSSSTKSCSTTGLVSSFFSSLNSFLLFHLTEQQRSRHDTEIFLSDSTCGNCCECYMYMYMHNKNNAQHWYSHVSELRNIYSMVTVVYIHMQTWGCHVCDDFVVMILVDNQSFLSALHVFSHTCTMQLCTPVTTTYKHTMKIRNFFHLLDVT